MKPRFQDAVPEALDAVVDRCGRALKAFPGLDDPRNADVFLARARAAFSRGYDVAAVVDDLRMAARCLRGQSGPRNYKLPHTRIKSRRLDPLHLSLLHADPDLVEAMGAEYGLPLMNHYAHACDADVSAEISVLSSYFSTRHLAAGSAIVGLAVGTYAATLGALMRGDDREGRALLAILAEATADYSEEPPLAAKRYMLQCAALADIVERRHDELSEKLGRLPAYAVLDRQKALALDGAATRREGLGSPDLVAPALVGLALLMNLDVSLTPLRGADPDLAALAAEVQLAWERVE